MKLREVLTTQNMARSNSEADRLIKQGSVRILKSECAGGFPINKEEWQKITDPRFEPDAGTPVIVSNGMWRVVTRDGAVGFDQLRGVGRTGEKDELHNLSQAD